MGTAKNQSRSKTKKRAARAPQAATKSKLRAGAKSSVRGRTTKPEPAKASAKSRTVRAPNKASPKVAKTGRTAAKGKAAHVGAKPKAVKRAPLANAKAKTSTRPKTPAAKPAAKSPIKRRRDATGHLDPKYARDLRALSREHRDGGDDRAFFNRPRSGDDLAEELGEEAVETMTSGEDQSDHLTGAIVEEERGGPFVKTRGSDEFARGTDRSNPRDATREPFPRT